MSPLAIIVHGGAKEIPQEEHEAHREGCRSAALAGWEVLWRSGSALDAVETAIRILEADPTFNAGLGSELNEEGEVQMDAGIMEGAHLDSGAVGFIRGVRHPISVARKVLEEKAVLLVGDGANRFARDKGLELCPNGALQTRKQREKWERSESIQENNTVGCVAIDARGTIAAGASTGGTGGNRVGRLGDTPQTGAGIYAENAAGGCSCTGDGEQIARIVMAKMAVDLLLEDCTPEQAAERCVRRLEQRVDGEGGCIVLDRHGKIGWFHNSRHMAVAYMLPLLDGPRTFIEKAEEWSIV